MADYMSVVMLQLHLLQSLINQLQEILCALYILNEKRRLVNNAIFRMLDTPRRKTRRQTRRALWVRPGRTSAWWDNFANGVVADTEWRENFRMSRAPLFALLEELRPYIEGQMTNMRAPVDPIKKVAMTLYYLSNEGRLRETADAFGVSRQSASAFVRQTCKAIATHLGPKYVKLPFTEPEAAELVEGFHRAHGVPRCLGAVDGTHVEIKQPPSNSVEFGNGKGGHCVSVQAVCDYTYRFMDVVITSPGSVRDARACANTRLIRFLRTGRVPALEKQTVEGEEGIPISLLGDPADPLLPFLMKEYSNGGSMPQDRYVGLCLCRAHMVIGHAFGRLKARFHALKRPMDINLKDLPNVIYSCFVLHNYCEANKDYVDENSVLEAVQFDKNQSYNAIIP